MLSTNLRWHYPTSTEGAVSLLNDNIKPHAGGTGILRVKSSSIKGFVELSKIKELKIFGEHNDYYEIGSMLSFADVCKNIVNKDFILCLSLNLAASTLLRNRITIGGSIADAPPWSDLLGPLMVLDAKVFLKGKNEGEYSVESILQDKKLLNKSIITKVIAPKKYQKYGFYRCVRVNFDYASFTISVGANLDNDKFTDLSIVVFGNKKRYKKLVDLASQLLDKKLEKETVYKLAESEDLEFAADEKGSGEYLKELFKVNLYRQLKSIIGEQI